MGVRLNARKPVQDLTPEDFAAIPVWEYASDEEGVEGRDETWVRPVGCVAVPPRSYTHVAAEFTAAGGRAYRGFVTVSTLDGSPEACQGTIFHGGAAWFVANPEAFGFGESRTKLLAGLGVAEHELFPLSFRLCVPVVGGAKRWSGVLP